MQENNSQIIIYQTESGETKLDVRFQDETVWYGPPIHRADSQDI